MWPPHRHARLRAGPVVLVLLAVLLAGCGGAPHGPVPATPAGTTVEPGRAEAESLLRLADTALRSGDPSAAAGMFERALFLDSGNAAAAVGLGDALLALGRYREAADAFERALATLPDLAEAHYGYARAMIAIRRPDAAVGHLEAVIAREPTNVRARNALGVAYDLQGRHELAAAAYHAALALEPNATALRNNLGLSLALAGKFDDALAVLRPLVDGAGSTRRTRQNLALVHGLMGQFATAERLSRIDLGPEEVRGNLAYFAALRGLGDSAAKAVAITPEPAEAFAQSRVPADGLPMGALLLDTGDGLPGGSPAGGWFLDLGTFSSSAAATERWHALRGAHPAALHGLAKLDSGGPGPQPLLVGPLDTEEAARQACGRLGRIVPECTPLQL